MQTIIRGEMLTSFLIAVQPNLSLQYPPFLFASARPVANDLPVDTFWSCFSPFRVRDGHQYSGTPADETWNFGPHSLIPE
jgi:hypothetical protein